MQRFPLTRVKKNEIAEMAKAVGLDLGDFKWTDAPTAHHADMMTSVLTHQPTAAEFVFGLGWVEWNPEPEARQASVDAESWEFIRPLVGRWLQIVADEHSAPDLWAMASAERSLLLPYDDEAEAADQFTEDERRELRERLAEIGRYLTQGHPIGGEVVARIEAKIAYLTDAVDRLDRFDFRGILASTLLGMAIEAGLSSGAAKAFFLFASTQLSTVFGAIKLLGG